MTQVNGAIHDLSKDRKTWLVTGAAGFIGSNISAALIQANQSVIGFDNFATGKLKNISELKKMKGKFKFIRGDIRKLSDCLKATQKVDYVLHQAALGSVPRSLERPLDTHAANVDGFVNILKASIDRKVRRFVFASSSSVYGDNADLPKIENKVGLPLSPYAASKKIDEIYGQVYARHFPIEVVGLRYFNVFGPRQDPNGPYAAVIPKWIKAMLTGEKVEIFGDGETSRDFCHVENVISGNILAATSVLNESYHVFNISCGHRTTLTDLYKMLRQSLLVRRPDLNLPEEPLYKDFRKGDIRHSHANIEQAQKFLGYKPVRYIAEGIEQSMDWYLSDLSTQEKKPRRKK